MKTKFDTLWTRVQANTGQIFHTKTGRVCSYEAHETYVELQNTSHNIPRSHFERAFEMMPTQRVADLNALRGYAYLWGIMMDPRIRQGLY
ncbi:hypothetical protein D3C86_1525640 [compost metagenome]